MLAIDRLLVCSSGHCCLLGSLSFVLCAIGPFLVECLISSQHRCLLGSLSFVLLVIGPLLVQCLLLMLWPCGRSFVVLRWWHYGTSRVHLSVLLRLLSVNVHCSLIGPSVSLGHLLFPRQGGVVVLLTSGCFLLLADELQIIDSGPPEEM